MNRRELITLLGGAAAASSASWPLVARAQQRAMPVIGFLNPGTADANTPFVEAFHRGLAESGYGEGRSVAVDYRWADGHYDRLPALAVDLVRRRVTVIAACGSSAPGLAAKAATSSIPIVFQTGSDPVADALVASMNRPGGNVTGVSRMTLALEPKRLELLHDVVPKATAIAFLHNPGNPRAGLQVQQLEEPARALGLKLAVAKAGAEHELDVAFAAMTQQNVGALLVASEPSYTVWYAKIAALAARHAIPTMFPSRAVIALGGLISYDSSLLDSYRQVGAYVARVLKGEKPADLPVMQPTKFELVINLKTAKTLGLEVPPMLLARADEVIE
jgi:putative ABC transport system substrate-binding protein